VYGTHRRLRHVPRYGDGLFLNQAEEALGSLGRTIIDEIKRPAHPRGWTGRFDVSAGDF
jgi:hypothetical protein